jgi:hypothetical protein
MADTLTIRLSEDLAEALRQEARQSGVSNSYDISADGQRFFLIKAPTAPPWQLVVVQHFDEELKRLVPVE